MSAEVIPFPRRETPEERLIRDIMADEHAEHPSRVAAWDAELDACIANRAAYLGGIDDLPFEELGDRPHLDLIFTEPKR